jgi:L-alanine-DL-glutamate epimerase-like enolase superfamily enzyme
MTHETSEWVIIEDETIEREYGWFFFYQSREYMETRNFSKMLAGNCPFLIDKQGGMHETGSSAYSIDHWIKIFDTQFEEK